MSEEDVFVPTQFEEEEEEEGKRPTMADLKLLHEQNNYIEKEIEKEDRKHQRISAILAQRQRATQRLQTQVNLIRGADQGYVLYLEQFRARRQPVWWYVFILLSVICVFGTWDKSAWIAFGMNVVAHKLLWRRLYVESNNTPQWAAVCIIIYTIIFVR